MPTQEHEKLIELFRHRPGLAAALLDGVFDVDVPADAQARLESGDLTECAPTEYRADAVVTLNGERERMAVVVVEVQRDGAHARRSKQ